MNKLIWSLVVLLIVLHQDFWNFDKIEPLGLDFLPVGLTYHALLSIVTSFVWLLAVYYCWPADVDVAEDEVAARGDGVEL